MKNINKLFEFLGINENSDELRKQINRDNILIKWLYNELRISDEALEKLEITVENKNKTIVELTDQIQELINAQHSIGLN